MSDLRRTVKELLKERAALDNAISMLSRLTGKRRGPGRPPGSRTRKRRVSVAARKKMAAAQRRRWAKVKARKKAVRPKPKAKFAGQAKQAQEVQA